MRIQINAADMHSSDAIEQYVIDRVHAALDKWESQVTRVEVHLHDDNADKHGSDDKHVKMEVRLTKHQPMIVEQRGDDMYDAISKAAKLTTRVQRTLEKLNRT